MALLSDLAVIIPVAPGDTSWQALALDLSCLPLEAEILFVSPAFPAGAPEALSSLALGRRVRWIHSPQGRAQQMNKGARVTQKPLLWFLHADTRFVRGTLKGLEHSLKKHPEALHFFDLQFLNDGPRWMPLNQWGVKLRARALKIPFGDQGLCLTRDAFEKLGGFDVSAPYGEDHLLVWKARQAGIAVRCTGSSLKTSARKYQTRGWTRTTLEHNLLTVKQALPEWKKLLQARLRARLSGSLGNKSLFAGIVAPFALAQWSPFVLKEPPRIEVLSHQGKSSLVFKTRNQSGGAAHLLPKPLPVTLPGPELHWSWSVAQFPKVDPKDRDPVSGKDTKKSDDYALRVGVLLSDGESSMPMPPSLGKIFENRAERLGGMILYSAVPAGSPGTTGCFKNPFSSYTLTCPRVAGNAPAAQSAFPVRDAAQGLGLDELHLKRLKIIGFVAIADSDNTESSSEATLLELALQSSSDFLKP